MYPDRTRPDASALEAALGRVLRGIAYHDLAAIAGRRGIVVGWTAPPRWDTQAVVLLAETGGGPSNLFLRVREGEDLAAAVRGAVERPSEHPWGASEAKCWGTACPGPLETVDLCVEVLDVLYRREPPPEGFVDLVRPFREAHRAMARRAVSAADVPDAMRGAMHALMDHGAPYAASPVAELARSTGRPLWDLVGLAASHRLIVGRAIGHSAFRDALLAGSDARRALRAVWPGLSDARLRRLQGISVDDLDGLGNQGRFSGDRHDHVIAVASALPPEWLPPREAWPEFATLACLAASMSVVATLDPSALLSHAGGDWAGLLDKVAVATGASARPDWTPALTTNERAHVLEGAVRDLGDPISRLASTLVLPLLAHVATARDAFEEHLLDDPGVQRALEGLSWRVARELVYGSKSIVAAFEASEDWHGRQQAIETALGGYSEDESWPPLFDAWPDGAGLAVVPVRDVVALREEGAPGPDARGVAGLDHCVLTRLPRLVEGRSHMLSVRRVLPDGGYERLSTAQVRWDSHVERLVVEEHRGRSNDDPPTEAFVALTKALALAENGEIELRGDSLAQRPRVRYADYVSNNCGYEWRSPTMVSRALAAWSPCLPRWFRLTDPGRAHDFLVGYGTIPEAWAATLASAACDDGPRF